VWKLLSKRSSRKHYLILDLFLELPVLCRVYTDYLRDMRIRRSEDGDQAQSFINPIKDWKLLSNTSRYDDRTKMEMIKIKSKHLDDIVKMKEKEFSLGTAPFEESNQLNMMLMNSIEAKLALLDKINTKRS
jgi:phosphoketolase